VFFISRLHDEANIKQTSSNHQALRAHVVHVHFEYICLMFAWCLLDRVNGILLARGAKSGCLWNDRTVCLDGMVHSIDLGHSRTVSASSLRGSYLGLIHLKHSRPQSHYIVTTYKLVVSHHDYSCLPFPLQRLSSVHASPSPSTKQCASQQLCTKPLSCSQNPPDRLPLIHAAGLTAP